MTGRLLCKIGFHRWRYHFSYTTAFEVIWTNKCNRCHRERTKRLR